jgi:flagellin-like hook-associated protein FlgL
MGLSLVTNVGALSTTHRLSRTSEAMTGSLRALSSGYRINQAADDAAGLGISEGLRAQIGGMKQAVRNAQDGISVLQLADGALGESTAMLQRIRDLAVQAGNDGALNADAKAAIQKEVDQLKKQFDTVAATTRFDGTSLLDGNYARVFQVGANAGETIPVTIGGPGRGIDTRSLGLDAIDVTSTVAISNTVSNAVPSTGGTPAPGVLTLAGDYTSGGSYPAAFTALGGTVTYGGKSFDLGSVDYSGAVTSTDYIDALNTAAVAALGTSFNPFVGTATGLTFTGATPGAGTTPADAVDLTPTYTGKSGAAAAIGLVDGAIARISSLRADLGAVADRFQHTVARLSGSIADTTASDSRIRDTDMASEMSSFSRMQILTQAGTAMLSQAAQSAVLVLKLLV